MAAATQPSQSTFAQPSIVIPALALFAIIFSALFMMTQGIGLDESQSLWQSAHSIGGIFYVVAQDVHVPLYHILLHFWQVAFGNSVASARTLSLIFYLVTIPLVYQLGRTAFDEQTALFGVALFALSPFTNWYGSVIRMYSLLALFTVLNQLFFVLIWKGDPAKRRRYWAGYFISAFFGMYTHYFFFFMLFVQVFFYFGYRELFPKNALRTFLILAAILALLFVPWLWYVHKVGGLGANTSPKLLPPTTVDVANTFSNFFFGFQVNAVNTVILSLWPLATLLVMLALQRNRRVTPEAVYFILTTVGPVIGSAVLSNFITPFYLSRYFIGIFPSCCLAISWFLFLYPRGAATFARTALAGAMVAMLGIQTTTASTISPIKEDYRDAAAYVAAHATARDIVAVSTPFTVYPFEYYYTGTAAVTTMPYWDRLVSGPIPQFTTSTLSDGIAAFQGDHQNLWLVLSYDQGYEERLRLYFDTHYQRVAEQAFSPDLTVYEYRLNYKNISIGEVMAGVASSNTNNQVPIVATTTTSSTITTQTSTAQ